MSTVSLARRLKFNRHAIAGEQFVLMDAGCEYHGYVSDITRTWPLLGEWSRAQADFYDAMLEVRAPC